MAYNKIFFQSGPTGNVPGWGSFVEEANRRGIPVFAAVSDTQSLLDDLIQYGRQFNVKNQGNYISTGFLTPAEMRLIDPGWKNAWGNYYLSSPVYNWYATRAEAEETYKRSAYNHVSAVLYKLPPALQPPIISAGSWNEPRPYVGWGGYEPIPGYTGWADVLGRQAWHIGQELIKRKAARERWFRWTAFNFSGGTPEEGAWEQPGMLDYLRLAAEHPDVLAVGLHEYSFDDWIWDGFESRSLIGRFEKLLATCDKHGIKHPDIQITEWGWNERSIPSDAMEQMEQAAEYYAKFPAVTGAAIWTANGGWGSASQDVPKLAPDLYAFTLAARFPDPVPPTPEPVMILGVDHSSSTVTAEKLLLTEVEFGYQRGISWAQRDSNGKRTPNPDPMLAKNVAAYQETGIPFGIYAQVYPDNPHLGGKLLAELVKELKGKGLQLLRPSVGVENFRNERPLTPDVVEDFLAAYAAKMNDGILPIIYTSKSQWERVFTSPALWAQNHPLWVAHYTTASKPLLPRDWQAWDIWQYAGNVAINSMVVDLNRATNQTIDMLRLDTTPPPTAGRVHWVKDWTRATADLAMDAAFPAREPVVFHFAEAEKLGGEIVVYTDNPTPDNPLEGLTIGRLFNEAYVMTSSFDAPRSYGKHEGYDFDVIGGTSNNRNSVLSVMDSQVVDVYSKPTGYGLRVIAESFYNNYHYIWWYGHLDAAYVTKGQFIKKGEPIGEVGSSGNVTGEHVHLTLQIPGHGLSGYVLPDVVDFGSALPTGTDKPVVEKLDLLPYLRGDDKRYYVLQYTWGGGGTQPVQSQHAADGVFYTVKGGGEYEMLYADGEFVYRGEDTSEAPDKFYVQTTNGRYGAMWCKRYMAVGERVERSPLVIHYYKNGCTERLRGVAVSGLKLIAHHKSYRFESGITLDDVVELMWDSGEVYFYAKGWGLVGFNFPGGHSFIAEIPQGRPNLVRNKPGCLPLLDTPRYYL